MVKWTPLNGLCRAAGVAPLGVPPRSQGGTSEQRVPLILNRAIAGINRQRRWRHFDAFELALNHAQ